MIAFIDFFVFICYNETVSGHSDHSRPKGKGMTGIIGPAAQVAGIIMFSALALAGFTIYVFESFPGTPWWVWPAGALVVGCVLTTGLVALRAYWAWAMKRLGA